MTVDPNRIECDYCGTDTRGSRSHEHYDSHSDGQVRHLVTSLCCGCECARERAELARIDRARKAETEVGVEAIADRIERRMGGVA